MAVGEGKRAAAVLCLHCEIERTCGISRAQHIAKVFGVRLLDLLGLTEIRLQ